MRPHNFLKIGFLFVLFSVSSACNRAVKSNKTVEQGILKDVVLIPHMSCKETVLQGIDSKVGEIDCKNLSFKYDYGRYANSGPKSLIENFEQTFSTYHYSNFFRIIGMDEKAHKSLKSKVKILNVIPFNSFNEPTILDCKTCNVVAQVEFEGKIFNYPFQENKDLVANASLYNFDNMTENGWYYKRYESLKGDLPSGLYIRPVSKGLNDNTLSIISNNTSDQSKTYSLIKSIRMKNIPINPEAKE